MEEITKIVLIVCGGVILLFGLILYRNVIKKSSCKTAIGSFDFDASSPKSSRNLTGNTSISPGIITRPSRRPSTTKVEEREESEERVTSSPRNSTISVRYPQEEGGGSVKVERGSQNSLSAERIELPSSQEGE